MMDWTDRHCRFFHRLLTRRARLYTEMVTTGALLHGDVPRHLDFDAAEHPVALQLGGSEPDDLAACARLGVRWGYDEINLNCGCPSERVLRGAFGACLMAEPHTVADAVKAMRDAVALPVTVKHRIGIDQDEAYGFVRDFVGTVAEAGCTVFMVHARNAWLKGQPLLRRRAARPGPRRHRGPHGRLHGAGRGERPAVGTRGAPYAGLVERDARRAPLAAGLVRPPAEGCCAAASRRTGRGRAPQRRARRAAGPRLSRTPRRNPQAQMARACKGGGKSCRRP